jgi:hypothetical protein
MAAPIFHHCMPLEEVKYGILIPNPQKTRQHAIDADDAAFSVKANNWLKKEVGFYPLFMAVGATIDDIRATGYDFQWRKKIGFVNGKYIYRKAGEFPNLVLFSFDQVEGTFVDYDYWFIALNDAGSGYETGPQHKKWIFKYSWNKARWLRKVQKNPCSVMMVVPKLD